MKENKFTTYLLYAIGEILLVVIGILLAIQIDGWNEGRIERKEELGSYRDIINDLRKDSVRFQDRIKYVKEHLNCYYKLNDISEQKAEIDQDGLYDYMVMTITFDPTTKANHLNTIHALDNNEIRKDINVYFNYEYRVKEASEEFNKLISEVSRPYILEEKNAFLKENVFIDDKYAFPPRDNRITLDAMKIAEIIHEEQFSSTISLLRMSAGLFLYEIEHLNDANAALIQKLEAEFKD